ncbi:MAG: D-2-hydroxyacid dehydrogenase [Deltaproteobacteria bacterium]|nr:D-2-hydroxyacid dehydrogenase [Deltaproteobacteria bacterium]
MNGLAEAQLVIFHPYAVALEKILSQRIPELTIHAGAEWEAVSEHIPAATILLAPTRRITDELLKQASCLRWIASTSAGNDRLARNPLLPDATLLTKGLSHGESMAEYVLAYLLFFGRKIGPLLKKQRQRIWDRSLSEVRPVPLRGQTIGVLGLGSIGQAVARRAKESGMHVLGMRRHPDPIPQVDEIFGPRDLDRLLPRVDCLVVVLPLTEETHHVLGKRQLEMLKDGALLINIGRGPEIDERALVEVLKTGRIRAVLDVCEIEPLPPDSELWRLNNVILTPHVSGIASPVEICDEFVDNYHRWQRGEPLPGVVDRTKGY